MLTKHVSRGPNAAEKASGDAAAPEGQPAPRGGDGRDARRRGALLVVQSDRPPHMRLVAPADADPRAVDPALARLHAWRDTALAARDAALAARDAVEAARDAAIAARCALEAARDTAVEEVAFLREQLRSTQEYIADIAEAQLAAEREERAALLVEMALLNEELQRRTRDEAE